MVFVFRLGRSHVPLSAAPTLAAQCLDCEGAHLPFTPPKQQPLRRRLQKSAEAFEDRHSKGGSPRKSGEAEKGVLLDPAEVSPNLILPPEGRDVEVLILREKIRKLL